MNKKNAYMLNTVHITWSYKSSDHMVTQPTRKDTNSQKAK